MLRLAFSACRRVVLPQLAAAALAASVTLALPAAARGPDNFSDLADKVTNAVVNISASTTVEAKDRTIQGPQAPQGSPFEELFEEFFRRRGQGGGDAPRTRRSNSLGSGFVIEAAGIIVTNAHVIGDANEIFAIFNDGSKLKADIIGKDTKLDLAVLKVKPEKPLTAVKFADSDKLRVGEWVVAVGNPFGLGGSVSAGIVSAINRDIQQGSYDSYIQTDAAINKGNSGGPLFNLEGDVVGINTAILSPTGGSVGIGFAVPSSLAAPVVEQLREFGETRRGWLGVRIQPVDDATAEALNLGKARGALVAGVEEKGPAKPAGIEVGDVIVKFNGRDVTARELPRFVAAMPVGKTVDVVVVRKGAELAKSVTLGRLPEDEVKQANLKTDDKDIDKPALKNVIGLDLLPLNDDTRRRYSIKPTVKGVVVSRVDPNSSAADKRIQVGEVIVEIGQEPVLNPADVTKRLDAIKKDGKKSALLLVANAQGEVRFVALPID
jgi:serine protease Do